MGKIEKVSVEVPAEFLACVENAVAGGDFVSVQHVVDAALRAWASKREADLANVRALIDEGIASGFESWDGVDGILAEGGRKLAERHL